MNAIDGKHKGSYVQKPILATFWLHVYCNFWQFANIGNSLHTGFPIGDVTQKLPFLEICQFWQLITHCFPIGDHVNQKLRFFGNLPFLATYYTLLSYRRSCQPKVAVFGNLPFLATYYTLLSYRRSCQPKVAVFGNLPFLATYYTLLSYRRSCQPKVAVFGNLPEVEI